MSNPKVKVGDKIIVTKAGLSSNWWNVLLEVKRIYGNYFSVIQVDHPSLGQVNVYENQDEYILADRKSQAKHLKERLKQLEEDIVSTKAEIERLEKYDTEEDFVASKLQKILAVKDDPKAIAKVLKTMKQSHYL